MLSVGVSGAMEQWIGMSDVSGMDKDGKATTVEGGVAQKSDSEFAVKGKLESDSGLTFSVKIEVEADNRPGSGGIDESQATVRGSFGEIVLGAEDGASVLTHHAVRDAGISISCGDMGAWIDGIKGCGPGGFGTAGHGLGDKNQISYFTPRISGVQFGATYIPNTGQEGSSAKVLNNDDDAWSIGANYVGDMGGASVAVSAGHYQRNQTMDPVALMSGANDKRLTAKMLADYKKDIAAYEAGRDLMKVKKTDEMVNPGDHGKAIMATNAIAGAEDTMAYEADAQTISNFGMQVGFGAFSFDVAYMTGDGGEYKVMRMDDVQTVAGHTYDKDGDPKTTADNETPETASNNDPDNDWARSVLVKKTSEDFETVAFGVMYSDGPMAVSLAHSMVEADDGATQSGTMLSLSYTLAPGIVSKTSLFGAERDEADGASVEGTGFVTGIKIGF